MKIVGNIMLFLSLTILLTSCNSVPSIPAASQTVDAGTSISIARTEVVMTQTEVPTAARISPTPIPPMPTSVPPDAYTDRIRYAKIIAGDIHALLPYTNKSTLYKEYSGCVETSDFQSLTTYTISLLEAPMETINDGFVRYFQSDGWEFTEATSDIVGEYNEPTILYDVYRISSTDTLALERLRVLLHDRSFSMGRNYIDVRAELTHIETKESFGYISDFDRFEHDLGRMCLNSWWY